MLYESFMLNMVWKSTERFLLIWVLKELKFEMENVKEPRYSPLCHSWISLLS